MNLKLKVNKITILKVSNWVKWYHHLIWRLYLQHKNEMSVQLSHILKTCSSPLPNTSVHVVETFWMLSVVVII